MVFRRAYDTVNRVGRAWMNLNQGNYNNPAQGARVRCRARFPAARGALTSPLGGVVNLDEVRGPAMRRARVTPTGDWEQQA